MRVDGKATGAKPRVMLRYGELSCGRPGGSEFFSAATEADMMRCPSVRVCICARVGMCVCLRVRVRVDGRKDALFISRTGRRSGLARCSLSSVWLRVIVVCKCVIFFVVCLLRVDVESLQDNRKTEESRISLHDCEDY